jgi:cell division protein DivIC
MTYFCQNTASMKFTRLNEFFKEMLRNKFAVTFLAFIIWLAFFDRDNWVTRVDNIHKLEEVKKEKEVYLKKIEEDKILIKQIQDPKYLEKFAREEYFMKKDNEEIYIVVEE